MLRTFNSSTYVAFALAALGGSLLSAAEPHAEFLRALQREGYGELALDYLDQIAKKQLPPELRETLDLERSKSLKVAASEAYNAEQRNQRLVEAATLLDQFVKAHPDHPATISAILSSGDEALAAGQTQLARLQAAKDPAEREAFRKEAKAALDEARAQFQRAAEQAKARVAKLPPLAEGEKPSAAREESELTELEARFKLAHTDYATTQTIADHKDPARKKVLEQAAKEFDALFQKYRGTRVGLLAHLWHGRTLEDLGDEATAFDCYDEVLVVSPEGANAPLDDAPLFGQAALFRLRLKAKSATPGEVVAEANEWILAHRGWKETSAYQGIAMESVKAKLSAALKATAANKRKLLREAVLELGAIAKVDSEYKYEALLLRRQKLTELGGEGELSADECIALGNAAAQEKDWAEATALFKKAADLALAAKNRELAATAQKQLTLVRYRVAVGLYEEKKYPEAIKAASAIVGESPNDEVSPSAAGLAVASATQLYTDAPEEGKAAALTKLEQIAAYTIKVYPGKAEGDDARMALAQVRSVQSDLPGALKMLDEVSPESKRYFAASLIGGQMTTRLYYQSRRAGAEPASLAELRTQAIERLKRSVSAQEKAGAEADPVQLADARLQLGEMLLESQLPAEAAARFDPLIAALVKQKPETLENATLRPFIGAVKAHVAAGKVAEAGDRAVKLIEMSPDSDQVNALLVDFVKLLVLEMKKAEGALIDAESQMQFEAVTKRRAALEAVQQVVIGLVDKMAARQQLSVAALIFLGDTASTLLQNARAREIYQRALAAIDKDPAAKESAGKATTRVRAQLIGLLRNEMKFDEALKQVDALLAAHPNALEPLLEKGRILEAWAQRDPKRFEECVAHWTKVRLLLERVKVRPPEYYDVLYSAAKCLLAQARAAKDPAKALQAQQMMNLMLIRFPKLSGPDMVARYTALAAEAAKFQGRKSTATDASAMVPAKKP